MADSERIARIVREVAGRYPSAAPAAEAPEAKPPARARSVALGADHGGLALKNLLRGYLEDLGYAVKDFGAYTKDAVDYPDYAGPVADAVLGGSADLGLLICNTGIGMSIAANRRRGIRAALCLYPLMARFARRHNDANVLVLGAGLTGDFLAWEILEAFLAEGFEGGRHLRRLGKIDAAPGTGA